MRALPVHERFHSWQGEGVHTGRNAFFIRLFGCPVKCPWCDSAGTWHPAHVPKKVPKLTPEELAEEAAAARPEFVVITGGEPAIHDLGSLTRALAARKLPAHIETSGAFELTGQLAWVTVSPKWASLPLDSALARADELKLIVEDATSVDRWLDVLGKRIGHVRHIWLHPEWTQRANPAVLAAITQAVKQRGGPFRAGWQMHKLYRADELDARSATAVPLGGDVSKGF